MKMRFAALAVGLVVSSVGCTAMNSCGPCGDSPCHITTSQMAPRATMQQGRCPQTGVFENCGWTCGGGACDGCGGCVGECGPGLCGEGYCGPFGRGCCGQGGCGGNGCLQHGMSCLLDCNGGCNGCGDHRYNFQPGPPVGQVAYPYYTTRGPRDFLMCNPPSIGPR